MSQEKRFTSEEVEALCQEALERELPDVAETPDGPVTGAAIGRRVIGHLRYLLNREETLHEIEMHQPLSAMSDDEIVTVHVNPKTGHIRKIEHTEAFRGGPSTQVNVQVSELDLDPMTRRGIDDLHRQRKQCTSRKNGKLCEYKGEGNDHANPHQHGLETWLTCDEDRSAFQSAPAGVVVGVDFMSMLPRRAKIVLMPVEPTGKRKGVGFACAPNHPDPAKRGGAQAITRNLYPPTEAMLAFQYARLKYDLSLRETADILGLEPAEVSSLERGSAVPVSADGGIGDWREVMSRLGEAGAAKKGDQ